MSRADELFELLPHAFNGYTLFLGKNEVDDIFVGYGKPTSLDGDYYFEHSERGATLTETLQKMLQWIEGEENEVKNNDF